ncbi:MAG TPA: endo-1,3-alpha-glucanase family glycosylhydrolase [Pilimelia sp.]|nr:endo-1,3-alpha-glucanase family glycosylhydrolase [Pilimelia sp.]
MRRRAVRAALAAAVGLCLALGAGPAGRPAVAADSPVPVLAYYYIWFNPTSWNRAKTDYPQLGRYSSDDETVMRTHVRWAKAAGIDGFIVSWKSTEPLNRRLEQLMRVAKAEDFKLAIIYQGLDFSRRPQPVARVAADLDHFVNRYAGDPVFELFDRPLVIWSGTWRFSATDIGAVTRQLRPDLLVLGSEKSADGYRRIAGLVDGDAYYWSSVNPETNRNHTPKLNEMGSLVHANHGLWIAPAAPGFDARMIGGTTVVERRDGTTLREEFEAALDSSPDAVGLISWNEFSENSHVEPSEQFGSRYLQVLADMQETVVSGLPDFDSSEPSGRGGTTPLLLVGLGFVVVTASTLVVIARRNQGRGTQ